MKIKKGDKVRVSTDIPMFYHRYNSYRVFEVEHHVVDIKDGLALLDSIPSKYVTTIPTKYLIKDDADSYKESQEDYFEKLNESVLRSREQIRKQTELAMAMNDLIEPPFKMIPKIMFNTEFWVRYEADLAKEIVLECVRQGSYGAEQAAEYAAKTAKQIVKHLKENK